ncbi:hypothetical protein ACOSQ3_011095 [Xanthoceras sorbifolium]
MHDVIRDMALWIACEIEEQEKFLVQSGAGGFFQHMPRLQVLNLFHTKIIELPEYSIRRIPQYVISNLSMLQVLRMFQYGYSSIQSEDSILFGEGEIFLHELVCLENLCVEHPLENLSRAPKIFELLRDTEELSSSRITKSWTTG